MWQGSKPYTLAAYAERIAGAHHWTSGGGLIRSAEYAQPGIGFQVTAGSLCHQ
ncbi:hypothetical protein [Streptomyces sp. TRM64462]|uniref:hypothetical protein n=1 Tax=Streptomyces sp. TRM64462 TaxID=2741726 RepID=UPI0035CD04BA